MKEISDLQCGKAGEYLVCADLILSGYVAFPSEQGLPFDVVVDVNGKLLKIQVKTTRTIRNIPQRLKQSAGYLFSIKICGKNRTKKYNETDVDVFALVALDQKTIGYIHKKYVKETMVFRPEINRGTTENERINGCLNSIQQDISAGINESDILKEYNISRSTYRGIAEKRYFQNGPQGRFLSDFTFEDAIRDV